MLEASVPALAATAAIQPLPQREIVAISAYRGQNAALAAALGVEPPATPRRIATPAFSLFWAGPNAWLAMSENPGLFEMLGPRCGKFAAVTEQGDGRSLIRVAGAESRDILKRCVPVDLHADVFWPDSVALTLAVHIGVTLWREDEGFVLACSRSYAGALHHALTEAEANLRQRG